VCRIELHDSHMARLGCRLQQRQRISICAVMTTAIRWTNPGSAGERRHRGQVRCADWITEGLSVPWRQKTTRATDFTVDLDEVRLIVDVPAGFSTPASERRLIARSRPCPAVPSSLLPLV